MQRYLLQALYPKLDQTVSPVVYAYRPGYSTHMAVDRVIEVYRNHPVWVLKTDIRQFFDRICWAVLMGEVERLEIEPILVQWVEQQLKAGLVIDRQDELKISVPVNRVTHIVLFGCSNLSHGAVSLCLLHKIPVLYLSSNGKYFGQLQTTGQAKVQYLIYQVQRALRGAELSFDQEFILRQASAIVLAKLHNSRVLLMRLNRRRKTDLATSAISELAELIKLAELAESLDVLLGYEGQGASLYFPAFASLLKGEWEFEKRTRRPPTDPVNSLLSLGYTLLSQNLHSMVEVSGLHTHFGTLHVPRDNHAALVSDLIEEFRALVVDSLVAYLINSKIFTPEDFTPPDERGGVYLHPDGLKRFLKHWEERLLVEVIHPHTGYKVNHRRCFELQVWEYIGCVTGERETYRPMRWDK